MSDHRGVPSDFVTVRHTTTDGTLGKKHFLSFQWARRLISKRSGGIISQRKSFSFHNTISESVSLLNPASSDSGTPNSGTVQLVLNRDLLQSLDLHQPLKEHLDKHSWADDAKEVGKAVTRTLQRMDTAFNHLLSWEVWPYWKTKNNDGPQASPGGCCIWLGLVWRCSVRWWGFLLSSSMQKMLYRDPTWWWTDLRSSAWQRKAVSCEYPRVTSGQLWHGAHECLHWGPWTSPEEGLGTSTAKHGGLGRTQPQSWFISSYGSLHYPRHVWLSASPQGSEKCVLFYFKAKDPSTDQF